MKILQEEKAYWVAQCLEAREKAEGATALANTYLASYEEEEKVRKELEERFELLGELITIMQRTGYTTSVSLTRLTADALREHCKRAEEYVRPKGRTTKIDRKDLVLIAWRDTTNGNYSTDMRPMGKGEQERIKRLWESAKQIP
ncbi:hypothetical protein ABHC16_23645, partial [Escherichia coli]